MKELRKASEAKRAEEATYSKKLSDRDRLIRARADKEELLVAREKKKIVEITQVEYEFKAIAHAVKAKLLAIPQAMAFELSTIDDPKEIERVLNLSIKHALMELSIKPKLFDDEENEKVS
jgi:phage terminase Nu1 subunit (DNA packaging protein)